MGIKSDKLGYIFDIIYYILRKIPLLFYRNESCIYLVFALF
ncbi:hypothetical protein CAMRE0001_1426 [Campylobacter rectus RM3267]|uniref:Uncharacterized protein n=1 Tax=Campylobacter rectus RM3267 TaxID=553218 RepID=B9D0A5_CAMRE|nr:hypothetical protein CAMRE0001_1426 [Campylobacter rectus RM3267]